MSQEWFTPLTTNNALNKAQLDQRFGELDQARFDNEYPLFAVVEITVGGAITVTQATQQIAANSGTADQLDTITTSSARTQFLMIKADAGDTITIKHATGNIRTKDGEDLSMTGDEIFLVMYDGTVWWVIAGSGGAAAEAGAKALLSGSTNGRPVLIAATATPGTLLHTAATVVQLFLFASNTSTSNETLTVEFGGVTSPDDLVVQTIPAEAGLTTIIDGLVLQGSVIARAFAGTTNILNVAGYIIPFTGTVLSGSTNGRLIKVAATATPGTTIHQTNAAGEEVWLWAFNSDTVPRKLTIELGGVTSPDDLIEVTIIPNTGLALQLPGVFINGSVTIRAFAAAANVVLVGGYVA